MFIEFSDGYLLRTDGISAISMSTDTEGDGEPGVFIVSAIDTLELFSKEVMEGILDEVKQTSPYSQMEVEGALKVARDYIAQAIDAPPASTSILAWDDIVSNVKESIKDAARRG